MISAVAKDLNPTSAGCAVAEKPGVQGLALPSTADCLIQIVSITKQAKNDMMNMILNALWFETRST
jgi:hypothetical protein